MARIRGPVYNIDNNKKKTDQGNGTYSRKPHAGGETFHNGTCAGSTPSKARQPMMYWKPATAEAATKMEPPSTPTAAATVWLEALETTNWMEVMGMMC